MRPAVPAAAAHRLLPMCAFYRVGRLFSEILEGDLDAVVVHLLILGLVLVAALGAAMVESGDTRNGDTARPVERLDLRRRSNIGKTIEIVVSHIVIQGPDVYAAQRLVADTQHLQPVALRRNVFVAPPPVLKRDTSCRRVRRRKREDRKCLAAGLPAPKAWISGAWECLSFKSRFFRNRA